MKNKFSADEDTDRTAAMLEIKNRAIAAVTAGMTLEKMLEIAPGPDIDRESAGLQLWRQQYGRAGNLYKENDKNFRNFVAEMPF